ncbi:ATP phosphoribosyltransferase regulatory subunit [Gymnodinialimonas sp.]
MARLEAASDGSVVPDVLQPVDLFVELAGEEFKKRLFLTEGADGEAMCLRPDFTIPVCLEHLRAGRDAPSVYHYRGKIFRKRRMIGVPEFEQAGTEWIGHRDEIAADADLFALAMECAGAIGLEPQIRVGDAHMFTGLIEALELPASWRERLRAAFGDPARLAATLARLTDNAGADGLAARLAPALAHVDAAQARAIVEAVVGLPQPTATGRTSADIAERILEQIAGTRAQTDTAPLIERYISIAVPLARAADTLAAYAREAGVDLSAAIEAFARRTDALAARGIDTDSLAFEASFGRRLNYYTGFVFDMVDPAAPDAEVIAGGRYDRLMAILEPEKPLPATGFSVWLDRIGNGSPA